MIGKYSARSRYHRWLVPTIALSVVSLGLFLSPHHASAQYIGNNLIDDNIFLNAASMGSNPSQIQMFLVNRGGYLATYSTFSTRDNATVPASQIIYEASQDYGVNPQVILAMLQKEQSLVTDATPLSSQLSFAMGYGCGDSSGCSRYSGFFNQVDNATWQLRLNFERARGNNTWWNSSVSYPCNGATRYYSAALKAGSYVTFYDDSGTSYASFTLNNASTAAMYCYTPHAYPGSSAKYYSGSYNFVVAFEQWFGSTQPAVQVSSQLYMSAIPQGLYTNTPVTVAFTLTNSTGAAVNVGGMSVAVRDAEGNNYDYALKTMVVPANATVTYTDSQVFSKPDTYTFWITNDSNGTWSDVYPSSSRIDNIRRTTQTMLAMPMITVQPSLNVSDMRVNHAAQLSFTVTNTSQTAVSSVGTIGLAMRAPDGANADPPAASAVTIPSGGTYTYTTNITPQMSGTYTAWIIDTMNNGALWNDSNFPANGSGVQRRITFTVNPSPTITQGPTLSIASPRVGQQVTASFKVKNYGDTSVNAGLIGMAVRDPNGRNVDPGSVALTVAANSEYTFQANAAFQTPGTYTAWITDTRDGGRTWDDTSYPAAESGSIIRKIHFTVLPSPTITVQPTITTSDLRVGKSASSTFTIHNYGSQAVNAGSMALAARDPNGRNVDFGLQSVTIPAGGDYVYTATEPGAAFQTPGTYTAWITDTRDGGRTWDDTSYPAAESGSVQRRITFTVNPSPTITQGPTLSIASPRVGQQVTASFIVHNFSDQTFNGGAIGLAIYDPNGRNVGLALQSLTAASQSDLAYQQTTSFTTPGTYTAWITYTTNGTYWDNTTFPTVESSSIPRKITFTVTP